MTMFRSALIAGAMLTAVSVPASAQELRIGYISTMTGPGAAIGAHHVNGWTLGLEHEGWTKDGDKLGGVATRIFYGDDQFKPDVGLNAVSKMIQENKVHIVAGFIWSNVMMAASKPIV